MTFIDASFEKIKEQIQSEYQKKNPEYKANHNDGETWLIEACAYAMSLQAVSCNFAFEQLYLETSSGRYLDDLALTLYGIERLQGAKPTAEATFTLTAPRQTQTTFYPGFLLASSGGETSKLLEPVTIKPGETIGKGKSELQANREKSDVKTEIITNPLPYLSNATAGPFSGGAGKESDAAFKIRCQKSQTLRSAAGSKDNYEFYALSADSRIKEVKAVGETCEVKIYYYSENMDDLMQERIEKTLADAKIKPLSDKITVLPAQEVDLDIDAEITLPRDVDISLYQKNALSSKAEIEKTLRIGKTVTRFQIINSLTPGHDFIDALLKEPSREISAQEGKILKIKDFNVVFKNAS